MRVLAFRLSISIYSIAKCHYKEKKKISSKSYRSVLWSTTSTSWKASPTKRAGEHAQLIAALSYKQTFKQAIKLEDASLGCSVYQLALHAPVSCFLLQSRSTSQPERAVTGYHSSHELSLWPGGTGFMQVWMKSGKCFLPSGRGQPSCSSVDLGQRKHLHWGCKSSPWRSSVHLIWTCHAKLMLHVFFEVQINCWWLLPSL